MSLWCINHLCDFRYSDKFRHLNNHIPLLSIVVSLLVFFSRSLFKDDGDVESLFSVLSVNIYARWFWNTHMKKQSWRYLEKILCSFFLQTDGRRLFSKDKFQNKKQGKKKCLETVTSTCSVLLTLISPYGLLWSFLATIYPTRVVFRPIVQDHFRGNYLVTSFPWRNQI